MRIDPTTSQVVLSALSTADAAEERALQQLTTGKRVNVASDDPAAASIEVQLAAQSSRYDQYLRSISSITGELQTIDSALNSGITLLQRALSLGVEGANGTMSPTDRTALANEIQGISQNILSLGNLTYNGKYVFGGTLDSQPPYVDDGSGNITYQGNDSVNQVEIADGQMISINQPGTSLFSIPGASVFAALHDLQSALESGSTDDIGNATSALRDAYNQLTSARVFYGNTVNQLSSNQSYLTNAQLQLAQRQNDTVGADLNQAVSDLVKAEQSRQYTTMAAARMSSLSLLDYLNNG